MEQLEFELRDENRRLSSLEWRYQFTGKSLVESINSQRLIYGHWDHLFGCWRAGQNIRVNEIIPRWPIFTVNGTWCAPEDHVYDRFKYRHYVYTSKWRRQANAAFAAYFSSIPRPYRSIVGPLGEFQWLALDLIWQCEDFARFLDQEILHNGGHFVCAMFVVADAFGMPRLRRAQLARDLLTLKRAQLIKTFTGNDQAGSLARIFSKLGNDIQSAEFYSALVEVMKCPKKAKLVAHSPEITWARLELLRDLPESLLSSSVLNLSAEDVGSANQLRRISGYLKDLPE